jgi:hypothetical protein
MFPDDTVVHLKQVHLELLLKNVYVVERINLSSLSREHARLNVVAADLSHRHKSDDFNSFLMHLFF